MSNTFRQISFPANNNIVFKVAHGQMDAVLDTVPANLARNALVDRASGRLSLQASDGSAQDFINLLNAHNTPREVMELVNDRVSQSVARSHAIGELQQHNIVTAHESAHNSARSNEAPSEQLAR